MNGVGGWKILRILLCDSPCRDGRQESPSDFITPRRTAEPPSGIRDQVRGLSRLLPEASSVPGAFKLGSVPPGPDPEVPGRGRETPVL